MLHKLNLRKYCLKQIRYSIARCEVVLIVLPSLESLFFSCSLVMYSLDSFMSSSLSSSSLFVASVGAGAGVNVPKPPDTSCSAVSAADVNCSVQNQKKKTKYASAKTDNV